jgi:hypothetical protein
VLVTADGNGAKVVVNATAIDYEPGTAEPKTLDTPDELPKWIDDRVNKLRVANTARMTSARTRRASGHHESRN